MNNRNWVCFDCRQAVRRDRWRNRAAALCPQCGKKCVNLGAGKLPRRRDMRGWKKLRQRYYDALRSRRHYDWLCWIRVPRPIR